MTRLQMVDVPEALLDRGREGAEIGSYTVMANAPEVERQLRYLFGRDGLALKVFKAPTPDKSVLVDSPAYTWGRCDLHQSTVLQNLFAREGLAPRVYGLVDVAGYVAQVTDYLKEGGDPQPLPARELLKLYGVRSVAPGGSLDFGARNWRQGKLVDFSHLRFHDYGAYIKSLDVAARTRRGEVLAKAYQPVAGLGIVGTRDIDARAANLRLDALDWHRRTVLDIGCNFGAFSRYAHDAGALRVVGLDKAGALSYEINNALGYWNMDIHAATLPGDLPRLLPQFPAERFDIVFMMAFHNYVGGLAAALEWVAPLVGGLMIVEGHGGEKPADVEPVLRGEFQTVKHMGFVSDNYERHQWHCWR